MNYTVVVTYMEGEFELMSAGIHMMHVEARSASAARSQAEAQAKIDLGRGASVVDAVIFKGHRVEEEEDS